MGSTKPPHRSDPFGETADTRFYWCGDVRSAPLAQVEAAINSGNVAVACAGAAGSGKTAFLCRLAEQLSDAGVRFLHPGRVVSCRNAGTSTGHVPRGWEGSKEARSPRLEGKTAEVLLLDDVDQLSRAEMAQLRDWWSILREKRQQVALVVTCAASAVDPDSTSRRQDLRSMIDTVVALPPLAHADIEEMIRYRLEVAGWEWEDVFAQPALDKVAFYAKGTPKRLVQICSRAMTLAEEGGMFPVGPDLVKEAAHLLFLPSHLREFSRKISMGLAPIPASLGGTSAERSPALSPSAPSPAPPSTPSPAPSPALSPPAPSPAPPSTPSPAPPPVVEIRFERRAYVEPRAPLVVADTAALPKRTAGAGLPDAVQDYRTMRHHEAVAARARPSEDAAEEDSATPEVGPPPIAKRRRRRGTISLLVICGIAIVTGALGYVLGQADMKPVEVVRLIPQPEPIGSGDAADAGASPPVDDGMDAPSPGSEIAPSPQVADPTPEVADPMPERADPTPQVAEPMPEKADPTPQVAEPMLEGVDSEADAASESPQPDSSKDDAALEVQADGELSPDAAETVNENEGAHVGGLWADWTSEDEPAESLSRLRIEGGDDGASVSASGGDVTAVETESTDTAAQALAVTQQSDAPATSAAAEEEEPAHNNGPDDARSDGRNDGQAAGAAAPGEALASAPAGEEPAVTWQFDSSVMRAQTLLAQIELYRGAIDGLLGNRTVAAIREFQRSISMAETGELSGALLAALEQQASTAGSGPPAQEHAQGHYDAVVDAAEDLQVIDIMSECRGKDAEWVYIAAINRHVLCGGLSAETPNPVPAR